MYSLRSLSAFNTGETDTEIVDLVGRPVSRLLKRSLAQLTAGLMTPVE